MIRRFAFVDEADAGPDLDHRGQGREPGQRLALDHATEAQ